MDFSELVLKTRSYRRFDQKTPVDAATLRKFVDLVRRVPSAANRQPLRYVASCGPAMNAQIFSTLSWAGALPDWPGPPEGERPAAYVVILHDRNVCAAAPTDVGIAAQTLLLAAVSLGLGGCMFGAVARPRLHEILALPAELEIMLVVALGRPVETIVLEDALPGASLKYYRESDQTHHVPKRRLQDVLLRTVTE
jgi:nitroreductase